MNRFSLTDKHILVTGASSGIGKAIAIACSQMGAKLIITARDLERLSETEKSLTGEGHKCIPCELTLEKDLNILIGHLQKLDGIVFCAGVIEYLPVKFINSEKVNDIFNINYTSQILLTQKIIKNKLLNPGASLVFISSISSVLGVPATLLYASSKAALNAAVKVLASELAFQKIRVNSICPGLVHTPLIENTIEKESIDNNEKLYPLGLGEPIDIANAAIFHLSDASRWLTGNIMVLDGGFTLN